MNVNRSCPIVIFFSTFSSSICLNSYLTEKCLVFSNQRKYEISRKSVRWEPSCCMRRAGHTDGRTDGRTDTCNKSNSRSLCGLVINRLKTGTNCYIFKKESGITRVADHVSASRPEINPHYCKRVPRKCCTFTSRFPPNVQ